MGQLVELDDLLHVLCKVTVYGYGRAFAALKDEALAGRGLSAHLTVHEYDAGFPAQLIRIRGASTAPLSAWHRL